MCSFHLCFLHLEEFFGHCQFASLSLLERVNTKMVNVWHWPWSFFSLLVTLLIALAYIIFTFLICRLLRQNIKLKASASIQSNVLLCILIQSTGCYVPNSRLWESISSWFLYDCNIYFWLLCRHLYYRFNFHAFLWESNNNVYAKIH